MAEEKKPKIDLKARLGKKSVGSAGGGSIPPPVGIPKPTPFGQKPGPKVDASDPYAAISAEHAPARAEPQAIKVELSEEVVQAQKKGRARIIILAVVTAVIGGVLGYALGGSVANNKWADIAVGNAKELAGSVDLANAKIEELANVVKDAKEKLANGKYPEDEVGKLGALNIPFDGTYIGGKLGIGRFQQTTMRMLIDFASGSKEANDSKESLQSVLTAAKAPLTELLEMGEKPKIHWGAVVQTGPGGPWLNMATLPEPFLAKEEGKNWPDTFKVSQGDKKVDFKRYTKGDPTSGDPVMLPVNPQTQAGVCPADALVRLRRELNDLEEVLKGNDTPGEDEKEGLLDLGHKLHEALNKVGGPG